MWGSMATAYCWTHWMNSRRKKYIKHVTNKKKINLQSQLGSLALVSPANEGMKIALSLVLDNTPQLGVSLININVKLM